MTEPPRGLRYAPHFAGIGIGWTLATYAAVPGVVRARFDAGFADLGLLMSAPLLAIVLVQVLAGSALERTSTARLLLAAVAAHAAVSVALDLVSTFGALLALRAVWGLACGLILNGGASHLARLYEDATATRHQGIYTGLFSLGGVLGFLAASPIVGITGWFGIHAVGGALALPSILALWAHRDDAHTRPAGVDGDDGSIRRVLSDPLVIAAAACYAAMLGSHVTLSTFITSYYRDFAVVGPLNAAVLFMAAVGRTGGGFTVGRRGIGNASLAAGGLAVAGASFAGLWLLRGAGVAALPLVAMFAISIPFGAVYMLAADATSNEGAALGVMFAAGNLAGLVFPPVVGAIRDTSGSYAGGFALLAALNGLAAAAVVVAVARR